MAILASSLRSAARLPASRRGLATLADASGVKVAVADTPAAGASLTVAVKAGSRFETTPGVASVLKNFAFRNTEGRSALRQVREAELAGGVLSSALTREHLYLTAEFLKGDEDLFLEILADVVKATKFTQHEFHEAVIPQLSAEALAAAADPLVSALDAAHVLAFRSGLGNSLFASAASPVSLDETKAFAAKAFSKSNIALLATGLEASAIEKLASKHFGDLPVVEGLNASATKYYGGEHRITPAASHDAPATPTAFVGFGSTEGGADLGVLAAHLGGVPSVKWSAGLGPLSAIQGASVRAVHLPYSDAALFGILIQAASEEKVAEATREAVSALKAAAQGVKDEDLKSAVAKAKFAQAGRADSREGWQQIVAPQAFSGNVSSLDSNLSAFDKVSTSSISTAASNLLKSKPTLVTVGAGRGLPYADELGL